MKKKCKHEIGRVYNYDDTKYVDIGDTIYKSDVIEWHNFCPNCGVSITKRHKKQIKIYVPKKTPDSDTDELLTSTLDGLRQQITDEWLKQNEQFKFIKGDK